MSSTIPREAFHQTFAAGVDLDAPALRRAARSADVDLAALRALDADGDGVLRDTDEIDALYDLLAGLDDTDDVRPAIGPAAGPDFVFDRPGVDLAARPDGGIGADTALYHGLVEAVADPAARRVAVARSMAQDPRIAHGFEVDVEGDSNRMLSPNPMHNGPRTADGLVRTYFDESYRCNLFVGDALWRSGLTPPTVTGPNWEHYRLAERWPRSGAFARVESLEDARPGDVFVMDYPGGGSGGGHLELVTRVETDDQGQVSQMESIGARWGEKQIVEDGARIERMLDATFVPEDERRGPHWIDEESGDRFFLLRPKREAVLEHQAEVQLRG